MDQMNLSEFSSSKHFFKSSTFAKMVVPCKSIYISMPRYTTKKEINPQTVDKKHTFTVMLSQTLGELLLLLLLFN